MSEFMRRVALNSDESVHYVCYHPIAEKRLLRGQDAEPSCLAIDYEYEHPIVDIFNALGWQGGTIHQAVAEVKRLQARIKELEAKITGIVQWLEANQPNVFARGLWDIPALSKSEEVK